MITSIELSMRDHPNMSFSPGYLKAQRKKFWGRKSLGSGRCELDVRSTPFEFRCMIKYHRFGRVVKTTFHDDSFTETEYDSFGNVIAGWPRRPRVWVTESQEAAHRKGNEARKGASRRTLRLYEIGEQIHRFKDAAGLGPADDLIFDYSGGVWNSLTGKYLGKIWEPV